MAETVRAAVRALEADETADVARPDGRPRQLRRHPLAARARSARGDPTRPSRHAGAWSRFGGQATPPTRPFEIRRRGTILIVARPGRPRRDPRRGQCAARRCAPRRSSPRARRHSRGRRNSSTLSVRPALSTPAGLAWSRSCGASPPTFGANRSQKARRWGRRFHLEAVHRELSRYRYCTTFFVEGEGVEPDRSRGGSRGSWRLTPRRGWASREGSSRTPMSRGARFRSQLLWASWRRSTSRTCMLRRRTAAERLSGEPGRSAAVAVCAGAGNRRLLGSLGAVVWTVAGS